MADVRTLRAYGKSYELHGLAERAEQIKAAAAVAGAMVDARLGVARAALDTWHGAHAATFATELDVVIARAVGLHLALRARAAQVANFPLTAYTSPGQAAHGASIGAAGLAAPGASGADPEALRRYVDHSIGLGGQVPALAAEVHLDGVTGTVTSTRPLNPLERAEQVAAGAPGFVVDQAVVAIATPLEPVEIAGLVRLSGVDAEVRALLTTTQGLEAFTAAVAAAIEAADTGLLHALALAGVSSGGSHLGTGTVDALVAHLLDPATSDQDLIAALGLLDDLAALVPAVTAAQLDGYEVTELVNRLDQLVATGVIGDPAEVSMPLAGAVAAAVGSADDAAVARFVEQASLHTLGVLVSSTSSLDARFLAAAFDELWAADPVATAPMAVLYQGDRRVAALTALARDRHLAETTLLGDPKLGQLVLTDWYADGGAAAGALLTLVYHDRVLHDLAADAADTVSLLESQALLIDAMNERAVRHDGVREALARIATLHLDDIAYIAENDTARPGWEDVGRDDLVSFYGELFQASGARAVTAAGYGQVTVVAFHAAVAAATAEGSNAYNPAQQRVGHLGGLFEDAIARGADAEEVRGAFWGMVSEFVLSTGARVFLASVPVTGELAALGGGVAGFVAAGVGSVFRPDEPRSGRLTDHQVVLRAAALDALIAQGGLVAPPPLDDARFRAAVLRGDPGAVAEFNAVLHDEMIKGDVLELSEDAEHIVRDHR